MGAKPEADERSHELPLSAGSGRWVIQRPGIGHPVHMCRHYSGLIPGCSIGGRQVDTAGSAREEGWRPCESEPAGDLMWLKRRAEVAGEG
jgi:hypothetical protein